MLYGFEGGCEQGEDDMRRVLVAAALVAGSIAAAAPPASACGEGAPCAVINLVCQTALGRPCIR